MANITLGGKPVETVGSLPKNGENTPNFKLTNTELSDKSLNDYKGKNLILNIFPSVDTGVCAQSVRTFNEKATKIDNTNILCISKDLPFAMSRFCGAEGIENVEMLSDYKTGEFGKNYGVEFSSGNFETLLSRSIVVVDTNGKVIHTEQVSETGDEPNYEAALNALK